MTNPTLARLAETLQVSIGTIQKDKQIILKQWRENRLKNADTYIEEQLAKLDVAEEEAWRAVASAQRSKVVTKRVTRPVIETNTDGQEVRRMRVVEEVETVEPEGGADLTALNTVLKILERRSRLLGLDAPQRMELEGEAVKQYIFSLKIGEAKVVLNEDELIEKNEQVHEHVQPTKVVRLLPDGSHIDEQSSDE